MTESFLQIGVFLYRKRIQFSNSESYLIPPRSLERYKKIYDAELGWDTKFTTKWGERPQSIDGAGGEIAGAAFGDSFVYGSEVGDHETWPAQLSQKIAGRVLNFGVPAYGIDQSILKAERTLQDKKSKVVIIGFILGDLNRSMSLYRHFMHAFEGEPYLTKPVYDLERNELIKNPVDSSENLAQLMDVGFIRELQKLDWWQRNQNFPDRYFPILLQLTNTNLILQIQERLDLSPWRQPEGRRQYRYWMERFKSLSEKKKFLPVVLVLPDVMFFRKLREEPQFIEDTMMFIELTCKEMGLRCLMPHRHIAEKNIDFKKLFIDPHFDGSHYSVYGNEQVAEFLRSSISF